MAVENDQILLNLVEVDSSSQMKILYRKLNSSRRLSRFILSLMSVVGLTTLIGTSVGGQSEPLVDLPASPQDHPTTSAAIYLSNLNGQFRSARQRIANDPNDATAHKILSKLYYLRGQYRVDLDEIQQAVAHASACLKLEPGDTVCLLLRAKQQLTLHRFELSRADLERAKSLGMGAKVVAAIEADLNWNAGRYAPAIAAIRHAAATHPTLWTLARLARLEHDLGNFEAAQKAFQTAEAAVTSVDPLPLAWLNVQRGFHYFTRRKLAHAVLFYTEAVRRLPDYVLAREHLAEALALQGQVEAAVEHYERIVSQTPHAESLAALARLYRRQGKPAKADALKQHATQRYDTLLQSYPEAMQWHAAGFFLGIGQNPERALTLLERNVTLRPTSESSMALAHAQLAGGGQVDACRSLAQAYAISPAPANLRRATPELFARCGF